jgi:hypothetical protein
MCDRPQRIQQSLERANALILEIQDCPWISADDKERAIRKHAETIHVLETAASNGGADTWTKHIRELQKFAEPKMRDESPAYANFHREHTEWEQLFRTRNKREKCSGQIEYHERCLEFYKGMRAINLKYPQFVGRSGLTVRRDGGSHQPEYSSCTDCRF